MSKKKDQALIVRQMIGQKFGRLTIISFYGFTITPAGRKIPKINVLCSCGIKYTVGLWDVTSGKTTSCGNHSGFEDRSLPAFNSIFKHSYQRRAIRMGVLFELTSEQFRFICEQNCHYCGLPPSSESYRGNRGRTKTGNGYSVWVYNGLDRVDTAKGYTLENVVPCCGTCNHAKHTMSYPRFIQWLDRISRFAATRAKQTLVLIEDEGCK